MTMSADDLVARLEAIIAEYRTPPPPPPPDPGTAVTKVYAGGDLQTALDGGGVVEIADAGATFERSRFVVSKAGTELRGNGCELVSTGGPALWVPPGTRNVRVLDVVGRTANYQTVFQLGDNNRETQNTLEAVPRGLTFERCRVRSHRGKRGFEVNAADVRLLHCSAVDVYNTVIVDSQALSILNTPGPVYVEGGEWAAASESVMVGGDGMKLPGVLAPANLTFKGMRIFKPVEWRTDGIRKGVKNLAELKSGEGVLFQDCLLENSWSDAQISRAFVFTPRNGLNVRHVTVERCLVRNVGGGIAMMAVNDTEPRNPDPMTGILVKDSVFLIDHKTWGGSGWFAQLLGTTDYAHIGTFDADRCYVSASAGYNVMFSMQAAYAIVRDPATGLVVSKTPLPPMERFAVTRSRMFVPYYSSVGAWFQAGSAPLSDIVVAPVVTDNVIGAASTALKAKFPQNTWVTEAEFKALPQEAPTT